MSHRETDDEYVGVEFYIDTDWRIVKCKDSIQWIFQMYRGKQWRNKSFPTTRDSVREVIKRYATSNPSNLVEQCVNELPTVLRTA